MKHYILILFFLSTLSIYGKESSSIIEHFPQNNLQSQPTTVMFWTNQKTNGPISIYFNGRYVGQITKRYSSPPECGASGCVTIIVQGKNNTWYGIASNGVKWYSQKATLRQGCNKIRLYSSGTARHQSNNRTAPSQKSQSSSSKDEILRYTSEATKTMVNSYYSAISQFSHISVSGYPNVGIEMGISRFFGEFARFSLAAGKMSGFHLFGGIGKNWIFDFVNDEKLAWHVGMGTYISWGGWASEANNQAIKLDLSIGETPIVINKALHCGMNYEYYFGEKTIFGIFGGLGFTLGNFKAKKPVYDWDFQIGIGIKLWSKSN